MNESFNIRRVVNILNQRPQAMANIFGSRKYPAISGKVYFYQFRHGVLVAAQVTGLPDGILGFHIHGGGRCTGTEADPFADALTHYNPGKAEHPYHAGDMPPLFVNRGYALQIFFTDRFSVREIIHKTVIIHSGPDDFTSQPAGNAGEKIACGIIEAVEPTV